MMMMMMMMMKMMTRLRVPRVALHAAPRAVLLPQKKHTRLPLTHT